MRLRIWLLSFLGATGYCCLLVYLYQTNLFSGRVAGSTDSINAIVTLGYCGDGVVGDGEDCDGNNLGGFGCGNIYGFNQGSLACDHSCNYDTSGCSYMAPTSTPIPTAVPTTAPNTVPTSAPTTVPTSAPTTTPTTMSTTLRVTNTPIPTVKLLALNENTVSYSEVPEEYLNGGRGGGAMMTTPTVFENNGENKEELEKAFEDEKRPIIGPIEEKVEEIIKAPVTKKVSIVAIVTAVLVPVLKSPVKLILSNLPKIISFILKLFRF